jgi:DNA-binding ferritin-like protein
MSDPLVKPEKALGDLLALMRAQYLSYQTSHWQVLGDGFYGNHQLFQRLYEGVQGEVDVLAEKMVGSFGREVVNVMTSTARILPWVDKWSHIDCHHKRGLQSELDFQMLTKLIHEALQGRMSLGMDDWLMSTASAHETHTYLLQQVLASPTGKTASLRDRLSAQYMAADNPGDSGAGSEEGRFFDNPEKREVREFAQTDALTNAPDVAAEAASEDNLDISKARAVSQAKKGPPTPDEIVEEPGGEAVSTLNRYIVETGEKVPSSVPQSHDEVPKHPVLTANWGGWNTVK